MIPNEITIHHSASGFNTTVEDINAWHRKRFNFISSLGSYVGYHYVIDMAGKVTQCRRDNELGAHCIPNDGKIGICLVGNFNETEPRDGQLTSLIELINRLEKVYNINEVCSHRDRNKTECPGNNLYRYTEKLSKISWLRRLIRKLLNTIPHV